MKTLFGILLSLLLFSSGCINDDELITPTDRFPIQSDIRKQLTIDECKEYFDKVFNQSGSGVYTIPDQWDGLEPSWPSAQDIVFEDRSSCIIVPIADEATMFNPYLDNYVTFYQDSLDSIRVHVVFFRADSSAYSTGEIPSLENFTGIIYEFWVEENQYSAVYVEDGEMKGCGCDPDLTEFLNGDGQPRTQVEGCKKPTFWEWLAGGAGDFGDFFAGLGNGIWSGIGWLGSQIGNLFNGILGTFKGNFPAGSNGGLNSWSSLSSGGTFSFGFGNGYGPNGGTNGFPGSGGSYNLSLHFSEFEIKKIQNVAEWMNNTYGVNLSNSELTLLMPINCIWLISGFLNSPYFGQPTPGEEDLGPECSKVPIIAMILDMFPFLTANDETEIEFLLYNHYDRQQLRNYASESEERTERMKEYIALKNSDYNYKVDRFVQLWNLIDEDPYILIRNCIEESIDYDISFWSDLASFTPNSTVRNMVTNKGYSLQLLNEASALRVNLDYFLIKIDVMPRNPSGSLMTNEDLLRHFRLNINNYSNTGIFASSFTPIFGDVTLWNSYNPLGSIIEILIPTNDGAVVLSEYQTGEWIFSTLRDNNPGGVSLHPVSGNREFGIVELNGINHFFIKGVDRYRKWFMNLTLPWDAYEFSDGLWNTTMNNFEQFIDNNQGQSTKLPAIEFRPPWNNVKAKLQSSSPFDGMECTP